MNHYAGKRVVVTGGAGFLGYHLVKKLVSLDANVFVLDDFSRGENIIQGVEYIIDDASDIDKCKEVFSNTFAVFNLAAAVAGVIHNQQNQIEMFYKNVALQTVPVLAADICKVPNFLQVSSVCVYEDSYTNPCLDSVFGYKARIPSDDPVKANAGYSWAKRMGEHAIRWSNLEHPIVVRPSNMFGPHDYFDERAHVIPALIKKCLDDDVIEVNGTGEEVREFIYIDDVADGLIFILQHGYKGSTYNIGTNGETKTTINMLLNHIKEITGTTDKVIRYSGKYDSGDNIRWANCKKMMALGWKSKIGLVDGLEFAIKWYLEERNINEVQ